jgi:DNA polymerase
MPTRFALHVSKWKDCKECELHEGRSRVVLARGEVPCDIAFVGEAPGESEDTIGAPFVGPAGGLLDEIIRNSVPSSLSCAFSNLVCCIPRGYDGRKVKPPEVTCIKACSPRLQEFLEIANPRLIVCVGALAKSWLDPEGRGSRLRYTAPMVDILHPSFILSRMNFSQRGIACQRSEVIIAQAIREHLGVEQGEEVKSCTQ